MKVLVADDSARLRERLVELLSGIPEIELVIQADNVKEALTAVRSLEPDLVVLDIQMPGGRGIDVLQEIKLLNSSTVVIVFTNQTDSQYQKKCLDLGADYFLSKLRDRQRVIMIAKELALSKSTGSH